MERKDRNRIKAVIGNTFICTLLLLLLLCPRDVVNNVIPTIAQGIYYLQYCSVIFILFMYLLNGKISKIVVAISIFEIIHVAITIYHSGEIAASILAAAMVIGFCMFLELGILSYNWKFLRNVILIFAIYVVGNLITVMLFPGGMYETKWYFGKFATNYLLGYDNNNYKYIFPLLCFFLLYAEKNKKNVIYRYTLTLIFISSIFICRSATSMISTIVWMLLILIPKLGKKILTLPRVMLIHLLISGCLVLTGSLLFDRYSFLIQNILAKSHSFSMRIDTWSAGLKLWLEEPIFGWGVVNSLFNQEHLVGFTSCHNLFLQTLYESGIVGLVSLLSVFAVCSKRLMTIKYCQYRYIILVTLFSFLLNSQTDALINIDMMYLFGMLVITYHFARIETKEAGGKKLKIRIVLQRNVRKAS